MKKKKTILIIISIILLIVASVTLILLLNQDVKYNNVDSIAELITVRYSESDIKELQKKIDSYGLSYSSVKSKYKIQCLRKTHQGYYAVLLIEDGKRFFIFMDDEYKIFETLIASSFKHKEEYEFIDAWNTTKSEVLDFDENTVFLPVSGIPFTAHITYEGIYLISYRIYTFSNEISDDPLVRTINFFTYEDFYSDELSEYLVPYILEMDMT